MVPPDTNRTQLPPVVDRSEAPAPAPSLPVRHGPSTPPALPRPGRPPARRHRLAWLLLLAAGLGGAGYALLPLVLGPRITPHVVAQGRLVRSVVATGRVTTPHRVSIASQITGTIQAIPVAEGQHVAAGQDLVLLVDTELVAGVTQADAALAQAEARLRQIDAVTLPVAQEALRQAEANLANAERAFARAEQLRVSGHDTEARLDEARRALSVAQALARSARVQQGGAELGGVERLLAQTALDQARANLELARARQAYARIRAPVAGTLIGRSVEPGWVVQPGQALLVLSPDGATEVVVQIDEKNLGLIAVGQDATASADAFPAERFAARLAYINPAVDPQRASVEVKLAVPEPPDYLRQDMTVSVDVAVAVRPDALAVPLGALRDAASAQPWVMVLQAGRAVRRDVTLGLRGAALAEVTAGLAAGERVLPASARVAPGGRVRIAAE